MYKRQAYIIVTECGIGYKLRQQNPGKEFFFITPTPTCEDMKFITLEKIAHAPVSYTHLDVYKRQDQDFIINNYNTVHSKSPSTAFDPRIISLMLI